MKRSHYIHLLIGSATLVPVFLASLLYAPRVSAPPKNTPDAPPPAAKTEPVITQRVADGDELYLYDEEEITTTTVTTAVPFYLPYTAEELPDIPAGQELYRELPEELVDACFSASPIPDAVNARINGLSYIDNDKIAVGDLSYLRVLHYTETGSRRFGEMIVNKEIADSVLEILRALYDAQYPIERMVLVDEYNADDTLAQADNNSYAFNFRGANAKDPSARAMGRAICINPVYNPYVQINADGTTTITPKKGIAYAQREELSPMMLHTMDFCYQQFIAHGFSWGGNWSTTKNYMYFEKNPMTQAEQQAAQQAQEDEDQIADLEEPVEIQRDEPIELQ